MSLLQVRDLAVSIGAAVPVDGVSFSIDRGETLALLGESGCGKSMTALSLMRLLPAGAKIARGSLQFADTDLRALTEAQMRTVRGGKIGMIFQEPATSLNPVMTVGAQIGEAVRLHQGSADERQLQQRVVDVLAAVGIPDAARRAGEYPFQMSGGMKQRVMIAMALAGEPELLIADEPTTALDVTIQAQILDLLRQLQQQRGMALLLITHDLGVAAKMADRIGVMHDGRLVELAEREAFYRAPQHAHSQRLFAALPENLDSPKKSTPARRQSSDQPASSTAAASIAAASIAAAPTAAAPTAAAPTAAAPTAAAPAAPPALLEVRGLAVHFPLRRGILQRPAGYVRAVDGLDLLVQAGRTLALVGESGCGKTTVGKALLGLQAVTAGQLTWQGEPLAGLVPERMQMVFQDPFGSLNPRMRIGPIITEGNPAADAGELLEQVGLTRAMAARYPHEFSGGQRQRIAIARALAVRPRLLICDEPTSALDVSVQAQVLKLLTELQTGLGLAYLFITHNIAVVDYLADAVAVMYLGRIVEQGSTDEVLRAPRHPYTQALLAAVPRIDGSGGQVQVAGDPPSPANPPAGCHFHPRCPLADTRCRAAYPLVQTLSASHRVSCHAVSTRE